MLFVYGLPGIQRNSPWNLAKLHQSRTEYPFINSAGSDSYVYVLDSGIKTVPDEFQTRLIKGPNFVEEEEHIDYTGHGTSVASIVGGRLYGVAKKTTLIDVKVLDRQGNAEISTIIEALYWVLENAEPYVSIVNLSVGSRYSRRLNNIVELLIENNIHVVIVAGNEATNACRFSPSSAYGAITVGAIDENDTYWSSSNWGECVTISSYGVDVYATSGNNKRQSRIVSGTSFAVPHVSGALALLLTKYPRLSPQKAKTILLSTSRSGIIRLPEGTPDAILHFKELFQ